MTRRCKLYKSVIDGGAVEAVGVTLNLQLREVVHTHKKCTLRESEPDQTKGLTQHT